MYATFAIDNALMHQKDQILNELRCSLEQDPEWTITQERIVHIQNIQTMMTFLELSKELWHVLGYAYKGLEIVRRIESAARHTREYLHHSATKQRSALSGIIAQCIALDDYFVNHKEAVLEAA